MILSLANVVLVVGWLVIAALAQSPSSCTNSLTPTKAIKPSVASGYQAKLVATGLTKPRSIEFDTSGNLLVVQAGAGIESLQLQNDGGTCVSVKSQKTLIDASEVTKRNETMYHGSY